MTADLRPAQPTPAEAAAFAELSNMASHDLLSGLLGSRHAHILSQMFLRDDNLFSHGFAHFATVDGQIAGLLSGHMQQDKAALDRRMIVLFMRYMGLGFLRLPIASVRLRPLIDFIDRLPPNAYYIQSLAVFPQFRGRGISKQLLTAAEQEARKRQARTLELDVETTNDVAIGAYVGYGLAVTAHSKVIYDPKQKREVGVQRMVKSLI